MAATSDRAERGSLPALAFTVGFFVFLAVDATESTQFALFYAATAMVVVVVSPFVVAVLLDNSHPRRQPDDVRADAASVRQTLSELKTLLATAKEMSSQSSQGKADKPVTSDEASEALQEQVQRRLREGLDNDNG